jgi:septal ring factor EnvC (AmiA/AmiB activator)
MTGESKHRTQEERITDLEAQLRERDETIRKLEDRIYDLESEIAQLEGEAEDRGHQQRGAYQSLLADIDDLFGVKYLPFVLRASLAEFGEML